MQLIWNKNCKLLRPRFGQGTRLLTLDYNWRYTVPISVRYIVFEEPTTKKLIGLSHGGSMLIAYSHMDPVRDWFVTANSKTNSVHIEPKNVRLNGFVVFPINNSRSKPHNHQLSSEAEHNNWWFIFFNCLSEAD